MPLEPEGRGEPFENGPPEIARAVPPANKLQATPPIAIAAILRREGNRVIPGLSCGLAGKARKILLDNQFGNAQVNLVFRSMSFHPHDPACLRCQGRPPCRRLLALPTVGASHSSKLLARCGAAFSLVELILVLAILLSVGAVAIFVTSQQLQAGKVDRAVAALMDTLTLARSAAVTTGDPHAAIIRQVENDGTSLSIWRRMADGNRWRPTEAEVSFPEGVSILPVRPSFTDAGKAWMVLEGETTPELVQRVLFNAQGRVTSPRRSEYLDFYLGEAPANSEAATPWPSLETLPKVVVSARTGLVTYEKPTVKPGNTP